MIGSSPTPMTPLATTDTPCVGTSRSNNNFCTRYTVTQTITSSEKETVCKVVLPAMTKVMVRQLATRDSFTSGELITSNMDDGIYNGVNTFDFKFETTEEKLRDAARS
ncbi:hypothetical protein DVH24_034689 [Malus domestica]|uniref:Uncharacterized protein n=1 Tax=Malus domestica TaxID=3750 RepID=A0A498IWL2_MALDO|nr:hypothetical protein DVH24_034689 [Malus domestica]